MNPRRRAEEIQSLHFANRNPANPMKTSRLKNFNRYTFTGVRAARFASLTARPSLLASVPLASLLGPEHLGSQIEADTHPSILMRNLRRLD